MRRVALGSSLSALLVVMVVACGGSGDAGPIDDPAPGEDGSVPPIGQDGATLPDGAPGIDGGAPGSDSGTDGGGDDGGDDGGVDAGPVVTSTYATALTAGQDMACVITKTNELKCWGRNRAPAIFGAGSTWKDVSVGGLRGLNDTAFCAIRSDDTLWCWSGVNPTPSQPDTSAFKHVAIALANRCAVATTGALYCWGQNVFGSVGTGDTNAVNAPTQIGTSLDWKLVAPGNHTCAINNAGALHCWGWNAFGQLGDGTVVQRNAPVPVDVANTYVDVSTENVVSCGVRGDGSLVCWGTSGLLGVVTANVPTPIDNAKNWAKVRLSLTHACAVKTDGSLYCWGSNDRGQLALPIAAGSLSRTTPQRVGVAVDWVDVAVGEGFSCGTKTDGTVRCWGSNGAGRLAQAPAAHLEPKRIGAAGEFASVSAGPNNVCAVRKSGSLACWGLAGALPVAGVSAHAPVTIGNATDWKTAKSGYHGACATKSNDLLHCWVNGSTPASTALTVSKYDVGYSHQCAIVSGSLYCWGEGIFGKLGNGSNASLAVPTKVGVDTWSAVGISSGATCGVKADGALYCFGFGYPGVEKQGTATTWTQLDGSPLSETFFGLQGTALHRWDFATASPATWGLENDWTSVAAGNTHVCGIRQGGTLWCRGENEQGQLGNGTLDRTDVVVQVGVASDWTSVTASGSATCGLRGGGDLYCWGSNEYGEIGDGTAFKGLSVVP